MSLEAGGWVWDRVGGGERGVRVWIRIRRSRGEGDCERVGELKAQRGLHGGRGGAAGSEEETAHAEGFGCESSAGRRRV